MSKQYYKLEFKLKEGEDGEEKWVEFHTGPDRDAVQDMRSLNAGIRVLCPNDGEVKTGYETAEWIMSKLYEVSVFGLHRVS